MATTAAVRASDIRDRRFWEEHFPELGITTPFDVAQLARQHRFTPDDHALHERRMAEDGYFQSRHPALARRAPLLADAAGRCVAMGLPPVFLFLFDEVWQACFAAAPALARFLGSQACAMPEFWFWHVDPGKGESGWKPHMDRGAASLAPDGRPLSLSIWIPLTEATPLNSCMYVLPAGRDPEYGNPTAGRIKGMELDHVRALPARPGEWLCWNQAVLHWGSASSRYADAPRISVSLEFQRGDIAPFSEPLIRRPDAIDFDGRLWLIAKQIRSYEHMYDLDPEIRALAQELIDG